MKKYLYLIAILLMFGCTKQEPAKECKLPVLEVKSNISKPQTDFDVSLTNADDVTLVNYLVKDDKGNTIKEQTSSTKPNFLATVTVPLSGNYSFSAKATTDCDVKDLVPKTLGSQACNTPTKITLVEKPSQVIIASWTNGTLDDIQGTVTWIISPADGNKTSDNNGTTFSGLKSGTSYTITAKFKDKCNVDKTLSETLTTIINETNDVYIAGYQFSSPLIITAKYWKNGIETSLPSSQDTRLGNNYSYANSIFVSGNDTYVCGTQGNLSGVAKIWKNGIATELSVIPGWAVANSIFVVGNDVYVGGAVLDDRKGYHAIIWKNGKGTILNPGLYVNEIISNIFVVGIDVYAVGVANGKLVYWKNGVRTILGNFEGGSDYRPPIYVSGNDVYVGGSEFNSNKKFIAKIWKNGVATSLTEGTEFGAFINSIIVLNNDVYAVGQEYIGGMYVARYWKNGISFTLPSTSGKITPSVATSIKVSGNDVYISGTGTSDTGGTIVKLWKNGISTDITTGTNQATSTSIFIVKK